MAMNSNDDGVKVAYELMDADSDQNDNKSHPEHKNKLGTLNGCYVPCLLNIMGIILFERLGWGIGQVGVSGVLIIFLIAEFQSIITVLSLSAIVTNGNMRGGGSYYMISRTLGPEFGGSIGLLFYAAYCVGVAFYAAGFAEEVVNTWFADSSSQSWLIIAFASAVLFICLIIALIGAECFTKINVILFFFQFLAIFIALCACFFRGEFDLEGQESPCLTDGAEDGDFKHFKWTTTLFDSNWSFNCPSCSSFAITFGVLFPAATGIMEGANLSGDLKNPTYSIPVGTLSAVFTAIFFYILLIISFAGSFNDCTLREDTTIMQEAAWGVFGTYLVVSGIIISASSSALGSLFGGSRVLQAISRDKLFPYTKIFEYGSPKGDEPRNAVLITWLIAQGLVFVGGIDVIAPISTSFFCLSYATVNLSCFLLEISGTPNWRPSFKYYTWHICFIGFLSNLVVMFYVDYIFGFGALLTFIIIFGFLVYKEPQNVWGDVTQSIIFHQVRKYLLRLDERKKHVKSWRPSILLLPDNKYSSLIDFCNNLKKGGLYIIGTTINGEYGDFNKTIKLKHSWIDFIDKNELKAFPQITISPNIRNGFENLILLSGLGALQPNTVIIPIIRIQNKNNDNDDNKEEKKDDDQKDDDHDDDDIIDNSNIVSMIDMDGTIDNSYNKMNQLIEQTAALMEVDEYTKLCQNILNFNKNVIITANFHSYNSELIVSDNMQNIFKMNEIVELEQINKNKNEKLIKRKRKLKNKSNIQSIGSINSIKSNKDDDIFLTQPLHYSVVLNSSRPDIRNDSKWIDIWLFSSDYTFDIGNISNNNRDNVFPMLMMQLSHILIQNKKWDKLAKLRILLLVDNNWNSNNENKFKELLKELRLDDSIDSIEILEEPKNYQKASWNDIINKKKTEKHLKKYYQGLNSIIKTSSIKTYFTFIKLPNLPPHIDNDDNNNEKNKKLNRMYYESLYILIRGLPPTALVATGEIEPVISVDL